jgi:sporulation protein YlmC with PRC-barrel domain
LHGTWRETQTFVERRVMKTVALTSAALGFAATFAFAQPSTLTNWDPNALYRDGVSARQLLEAPVRADTGRRIGEVKDIIVDRNGYISKLVVEVGGFVELGDQHIGIPWKDVSIGEDMEFVHVPLREVEKGTYSLYGEVPQGENVAMALASWRVNELIGDYARLADVPRYGLVTDVIFDNRGVAKAVIVERGRPAGGRGAYAFPFAGFERGSLDYALPYRRDAVAALQPFDYAKLDQQSRYAGPWAGRSQREAQRASGGAAGATRR